jgi:hypothetical protein
LPPPLVAGHDALVIASFFAVTKRGTIVAVAILSALAVCAYFTFWRPYGCGDPKTLVDRQIFLDRQVSDLHITHTITPFRSWTGQCYAVHRAEQRIGGRAIVTTTVFKLNSDGNPTITKRVQCVSEKCRELEDREAFSASR